jgi:hypothetical protein
MGQCFTPSADTYLNGYDPTTNFGSQPTCWIGGSANGPTGDCLVKWDLSSVPTAAQVDCYYVMLDVSNGSQGNRFVARPLLRDWVELQANWTQAKTSLSWTTPGALGLRADHGQSAVFFSSAEFGIQYANMDPNSGGLGVVQGWVNNPPSNRGVAMFANLIDAAQIQMRETTTGSAPRLCMHWH